MKNARNQSGSKPVKAKNHKGGQFKPKARSSMIDPVAGGREPSEAREILGPQVPDPGIKAPPVNPLKNRL